MDTFVTKEGFHSFPEIFIICYSLVQNRRPALPSTKLFLKTHTKTTLLYQFLTRNEK